MNDIVLEILKNLTASDATNLASLFGYFYNLIAWRTQQREARKKDDLDSYLEFARRNDHKKLEELILANREAFERLFGEMENSIVAAIEQLNRDQQRRHEESGDLRVLTNRVKLKIKNQFTATSFQQDSTWQEHHLFASITIVNQNRSKMTISSARVEVDHPDHSFIARLDGGSTEIEGGGGSKVMRFASQNHVRWRQGEKYQIRTIALTVDQEDRPLEFNQSDIAGCPE